MSLSVNWSVCWLVGLSSYYHVGALEFYYITHNCLESVNSIVIQVDMVLGGYQIPKGTIVNKHGIFSASNAKYFHAPDKFIPERWIRGKEQG